MLQPLDLRQGAAHGALHQHELGLEPKPHYIHHGHRDRGSSRGRGELATQKLGPNATETTKTTAKTSPVTNTNASTNTNTSANSNTCTNTNTNTNANANANVSTNTCTNTNANFLQPGQPTPPPLIKAGKLNLVDLAGSERISQTGTTGAGMVEATKINGSLSVLGRVIGGLAEGSKAHIPWRESKLTLLLKDSLGGNTRTAMVANLSPSRICVEDSIATLRFATRVKKVTNKHTVNADPRTLVPILLPILTPIYTPTLTPTLVPELVLKVKNKPVVNEDPRDAVLRKYQIEIQKLQAKVSVGRISAGT